MGYAKVQVQSQVSRANMHSARPAQYLIFLVEQSKTNGLKDQSSIKYFPNTTTTRINLLILFR